MKVEIFGIRLLQVTDKRLYLIESIFAHCLKSQLSGNLNFTKCIKKNVTLGMHTSASVIFVPDSVCLDDDTGKGVNSGVDIDLECE